LVQTDTACCTQFMSQCPEEDTRSQAAGEPCHGWLSLPYIQPGTCVRSPVECTAPYTSLLTVLARKGMPGLTRKMAQGRSARSNPDARPRLGSGYCGRCWRCALATLSDGALYGVGCRLSHPPPRCCRWSRRGAGRVSMPTTSRSTPGSLCQALLVVVAWDGSCTYWTGGSRGSDTPPPAVASFLLHSIKDEAVCPHTTT
jgi:hypothetical protein